MSLHSLTGSWAKIQTPIVIDAAIAHSNAIQVFHCDAGKQALVGDQGAHNSVAVPACLMEQKASAHSACIFRLIIGICSLNTIQASECTAASSRKSYCLNPIDLWLMRI